MLTTSRGDLLTVGGAFAVFFASSGIESLRIGLNRAYGVTETRHWVVLRLESIGYVIVGAISMLALGFLIVLGPLIFATALRYFPWLAPLENTFTFLRYAVATVVLVVSLLMMHMWLPGGRRRLRDIMPGIIRDTVSLADLRRDVRALSRANSPIPMSRTMPDLRLR